MIYICLFHDYIILSLTNWKLSNQCVNLFHIIKCISQLVYQLELLLTMHIHLIVSITQLKPAPENDSYNCQSNINSPFIQNDFINNKDNNIKTPFYKIKHLIQKHIIQHDCSKPTTQYLMHWKEYNHSHNAWYDVKDLENVKELIVKYKQQVRNTTDWATHFLLLFLLSLLNTSMRLSALLKEDRLLWIRKILQWGHQLCWKKADCYELELVLISLLNVSHQVTLQSHWCHDFVTS